MEMLGENIGWDYWVEILVGILEEILGKNIGWKYWVGILGGNIGGNIGGRAATSAKVKTRSSPSPLIFSSSSCSCLNSIVPLSKIKAASMMRRKGVT